jgi:tRNA dimethylallyltransferase
MQFQVSYPNPLIVIVGPTAVGKTTLAVELAERLNGEIVSADSRLFYRGMDIGTDKPSASDRLRVPHHLIDVADPDETWSLAVYKRAAARAISEIQGRGKIPFLVGGTGQYIRAVIEGWELPVQQPDTRLRAVLEAWGVQIGPEALHQKLALMDPEAAARIERRNLRRTIRALEVIFHTGKRFSRQRRKAKAPYSLLVVGLNCPREALYERIDKRIDEMFARGLLSEVENLLASDYSIDLPSFSAIGYQQMIAYLAGDMTMEEAAARMRQLTHQFVRRQANWFKLNDPGIRWFSADEGAAERVESYIRSGEGWQPFHN